MRLFNSDHRGTRLTRASNVFLEDVQRVFVVLEQALKGVKAAAYGHFDTLRVAISDGVAAGIVPRGRTSIQIGIVITAGAPFGQLFCVVLATT